MEPPCVGRVPAPKSAQKPAPCRPEAGRQALFFDGNRTRPAFYPEKHGAIQPTAAEKRGEPGLWCGQARGSGQRNDRVGRSLASGARPPVYRDGGNAARDRVGWVNPPPGGGHPAGLPPGVSTAVDEAPEGDGCAAVRPGRARAYAYHAHHSLHPARHPRPPRRGHGQYQRRGP